MSSRIAALRTWSEIAMRLLRGAPGGRTDGGQLLGSGLTQGSLQPGRHPARKFGAWEYREVQHHCARPMSGRTRCRCYINRGQRVCKWQAAGDNLTSNAQAISWQIANLVLQRMVALEVAQRVLQNVLAETCRLGWRMAISDVDCLGHVDQGFLQSQLIPTGLECGAQAM